MQKSKHVDPKSLTPEQMNARVEMVCRTLLECCDLNGFNKSECVSAMASLIATIFAQNRDKPGFKNIVKMMIEAVEEELGPMNEK